jgi:hypothetical protein
MVAAPKLVGPMDAPPPGTSPGATSGQRLERALAATLKRNQERPVIDVAATFDASAMTLDERTALVNLVTQMEHIEKNAPLNLGAIARAAPLDEVATCYTAQILDEIVHGKMLREWLARTEMRAPVRAAARWGVTIGAVIQRDAWLGTKNLAVLTELYASALLDALLEGGHVREPALRVIFESIQKDEHRHKVIAIESVRLMRAHDVDKRLIVRVLGGAIENGTVMWFRTVFARYIAKHCAALDLKHDLIIERTLDEAASA